ESEAKSLMRDAGVDSSDVQIHRFADMRFVGQGFEIPAMIPDGLLSEATRDQIEKNFIDAYAELFGRRVTDIGVEALTWRVHASARRNSIDLKFPILRSTESAKKGSRRVFFPGIGFQDCSVFDRKRLSPGSKISGPAIVEERESTTVLG